MQLWVKLGLFLSSYLPLFLILAIKNWYNLALNIVLLFVIGYSLIWFIIIRLVNKSTTESYTVVKVESKTKDALSYLIPYIISFIAFDIDKMQDIISLIILLLILFVVSINSEIIYVNPILYFIKYDIYDIEACKPYIDCEKSIIKIVLIAKSKIKKGSTIDVRNVDGNVMLEATK